MPQVELHVELRDIATKKPKALRREGKVPGIFYMRRETPIPLAVSAKELKVLIQQEAKIMNTIFPDGKVQKSVLREIQRDPVSDAFVHVDIMGISLTEKVKLSIPILFKGTPAGVKEGGVLEHPLREIEIEGLPLDIPEHVEVDVAHLNIGQSVTVKDLAVDTSKVRIVTDMNQVVANVSQPKIQKIEEPVVEEAAAVEGEEKKEEKAPEGEPTSGKGKGESASAKGKGEPASTKGKGEATSTKGKGEQTPGKG